MWVRNTPCSSSRCTAASAPCPAAPCSVRRPPPPPRGLAALRVLPRCSSPLPTTRWAPCTAGTPCWACCGGAWRRGCTWSGAGRGTGGGGRGGGPWVAGVRVWEETLGFAAGVSARPSMRVRCGLARLRAKRVWPRQGWMGNASRAPAIPTVGSTWVLWVRVRLVVGVAGVVWVVRALGPHRSRH